MTTDTITIELTRNELAKVLAGLGLVQQHIPPRVRPALASQEEYEHACEQHRKTERLIARLRSKLTEDIWRKGFSGEGVA